MQKFLFYSLAILLIFTFFLPQNIYSENNNISISFHQIYNFAQKNSPEMKLILGNIDLELNNSELALQASNPVISYFQEYVKNDLIYEREHVLSLSKTFEMPWLYNKRKKTVNLRKETIEFKKVFQTRNYFKGLKIGYVKLKYLNTFINKLNRLIDIADKIDKIAIKRSKAGFLPGYQKQLIAIVLLNLNGKLLKYKQFKVKTENLWKSKMGVEADINIDLVTDIQFKPISFKLFRDLEKIINETPEYKIYEKINESSLLKINIEKQNIIPDFTVSGGYKALSSNLKGYTFGLSFNLPILNRNQIKIKQKRIELKLNKKRSELFKKNQIIHLKHKLNTIKENIKILKKMNKLYLNIENEIKSVSNAFSEGYISLIDFTNILQNHIDGIEQYYLNIGNYFNDVFELETISGRSLLKFSSK